MQGLMCGVSTRFNVRCQHKVLSAVSAQGLMCGVSTRFYVRCQHKDKSAVSALGSSMSDSVVSTLFWGTVSIPSSCVVSTQGKRRCQYCSGVRL